MKEKEAIVSSTKAKLASLQADHNTSGSALSSLEELLLDKDRQIERHVSDSDDITQSDPIMQNFYV